MSLMAFPLIRALTLVLVMTATASAAEPKRVLLVHSSAYALSPWANFAASFRNALAKQSSEPIRVYEVSYDAARFARRPGDERSFVEYVRAEFADRKVDLIVPIAVPATRFLQRHRSALFANVPMLVVGTATGRIPEDTLRAGDGIVSIHVRLVAYIDNILRVRPDTRNIVVISGNSPAERYWASALKKTVQPYTDRIKFSWLEDLSFDEILARVSSLPEHTAIMYFLFSVDAKNVPYLQDSALEELHEVANAPIFGTSSYQLGRGIVGGPLDQTQAIGKQAADLALRMLNGEKSQAVLSRTVEFASAYDWRELQRWDISEALLPPGSVVRFREPTILQRYWWEILLVAAVLAIQSLLIIEMLHERRRRAAAEVATREHMSELAVMNRRAEAGHLSASIAHEINQPLAAIGASGSAALRWLSRKTPDLDRARSALHRIVNDSHRAAEVVDTVRAMFRKEVQNRTKVDVNELVAQVLDLWRSELSKQAVTVRKVETDALPRILVDRVQLEQVIINLIRNAIDAMSTVAEHERILRIRTKRNDGEVVISVEDSGAGLDPANAEKIFTPFFTTKPQGMGMGLSICRSLVEAHGGRLTARPGASRGAVFEIALPVNGGQSGDNL
jgi:signal transduction histidine kinase